MEDVAVSAEELRTPGSNSELTICCVFGKGTYRLLLLVGKQLTPCGGQAIENACKSEPKNHTQNAD